MKERPILFSGPMVREILAGRKTQTRRIVKGEFSQWEEGWSLNGADPRTLREDWCPYGQPGDLLWVRETWADVNSENGPSLLYRADGDMRCWEDFSTVFDKDYGAGPSFSYETYPGEYVMWWGDLWAGEPDHHWRPSTHMPRWASRLTLEITDVRVQRLRDISEEDAESEGVNVACRAPVPGPTPVNPTCTECCKGKMSHIGSSMACPQGYGTCFSNWTWRGGFAYLWDSTNRKRAPWDSNPLVWAITFKKSSA
jgi:hypothetical protein